MSLQINFRFVGFLANFTRIWSFVGMGNSMFIQSGTNRELLFALLTLVRSGIIEAFAMRSYVISDVPFEMTNPRTQVTIENYSEMH